MPCIGAHDSLINLEYYIKNMLKFKKLLIPKSFLNLMKHLPEFLVL